MKKNPHIPHGKKSIPRWFLFSALSLAASLAAASNDESKGDPKTHTLFMGADISVQVGHDLGRVVDVGHDSFIVDVGGRRQTIPMHDGPINLQVAPGLRLTEVSAKVANLKAERAYTLHNDPSYLLTKSLNDSEVLLAGWSAANSQMAKARDDLLYSNLAQLNNPVIGGPDPQLMAQYQAAVQRATDANNAALAGPGSSLNGSANGDLASTGFDALDVTFEISAEHPLAKPYLILVARYRTGAAQTSPAKNWIFASSLSPITPTKRKVHVSQGGFPPDFALEGLQVHLYNNGVEVATDVADKRVLLTADEAFEYLRMEYVGDHKGATLPAAPAMGHLPADLPVRLANGQYKQTYFVRVTKEGMAGDAFLDESCTQPLNDPYVIAVVRALRYNPALDNGKPVDGVAPLHLNQLPL
ncbi:MAG TPA: hypothetical protein VGM73_06685 [Candidatus Didemnitutus sp.]|jgi:hypothetical protein